MEPEGPHRGRRETEGMVSVEQQDPGQATQVPELACNVGAGGCLQTGCASCRGLQTPGWLPFSGAEGHCCVRKPQASPSGGAVCKRGLADWPVWGPSIRPVEGAVLTPDYFLRFPWGHTALPPQ